VLGYEPPLSDAIEVTRQVRAKAAKTEVLIFAARDDEDSIFYLLQAGGYVLKSDGNQQLIRRDRSACSPQALLYHQALREVGPVLYEAAREREKW